MVLLKMDEILGKGSNPALASPLVLLILSRGCQLLSETL